MKQRVADVVLWLAFGLALAASVSHLAWAFGELEFARTRWMGWPAAVAVDAGLAALAYSIQQRRRAGRGAGVLWLGVIGFSFISAFANLEHALAVVTANGVTLATFGAADAFVLLKAVLLSATLPLLVVYLGEVVSSDDNATLQWQAAFAALESDLAATRAELERAYGQLAELTRPTEATDAPLDDKPAPTVEAWRAIAAGLNGQRATLDWRGVNELLLAAGYAPAPATTARRWAELARQMAALETA